MRIKENTTPSQVAQVFKNSGKIPKSVEKDYNSVIWVDDSLGLLPLYEGDQIRALNGKVQIIRRKWN